MTKAEEMRVKATGISLTKEQRIEKAYRDALEKIERRADDGQTGCIVDCDMDLRHTLISMLKNDGFNAFIYTGFSIAGTYEDVRVEW